MKKINASSYIKMTAHDKSGTFSGYLAVPANGKGPGLVLAHDIFGLNTSTYELAKYYAEEGYVVLVPDLFWRQQPKVTLGYNELELQSTLNFFKSFDLNKSIEDIQVSLNTLRARPEIVGKVGMLGFCLGGKLAYLAACRTDVDVAIGYYGAGIEENLNEATNIKGRLLLHIAELDSLCPLKAQTQIIETLSGRSNIELYLYPGVDHAFACVDGNHYNKTSARLAHQRSVTALRHEIGPIYDLSMLWDKHCEYEFVARNVPEIMATMVTDPYVNHIPTMTGGVGTKMLSRFYKYHFVDNNPPDTTLIPISRTIGATQIVDEVLFCFTHTCEIDWMLPGIAPTGKRVEIPLVAIVKFRGDKLYHEHIYWDQASVLVQIGKLDPTGLPVAGVETAYKLLDEHLPSNTLMAAWVKSPERLK